MSDDSPATPPAPEPAEVGNANATLTGPMQTLYFKELRKEILAVKARLSRLIVVGLVGVPILTHFALNGGAGINWPLILSPVLVMLLLVLYFSEQLSMMRAGSFIHQQIEATGHGWEHWMDDLRKKAAEPPLFGLLVVVSVAYSLLMASFAMETIWYIDSDQYSYFSYFLLVYAVPGMYALTFVWVVATLFWFWHAAFRAEAN
jgi:hypothetical protein